MDFELAGRYFGSAFGSAPIDLMMKPWGRLHRLVYLLR
jgi:hypothetical protein